MPRPTGSGNVKRSWLRAGVLSQERNQTCAHLFRLFLLHPVTGAIQEVKAHHLRAGGRLHFLNGAGRLVDAPVALARDVDSLILFHYRISALLT